MARRPLNFYTQRPQLTSIVGFGNMVQLTRIGKIHLGIRVPTTKEGKNEKCRKANHPNEEMCQFCSYPVQTPYFVFGGPESYPAGILDAVRKEYGEKPKELHFWFPTENRSLVFPQALKWYKGPRCVCRGDGQTAIRVDEKTGGTFSMTCPCAMYGKGCNPRASLMIALYKIKIQGCFQIDTGSIHNMARCNSFMNELAGDPQYPETRDQSLLRRISYVPCRLSLMPEMIMTPEGKPVEKPLWNFMFDGDGKLAAQLRQRDAISALLPGEPAVPALPPPAAETPEVEDEGPTFNGKPATPPDEQPRPGDATVEVKAEPAGESSPSPGPPPEREPGADEAEDGDARVSEPPPKESSGIPSYLNKAGDKEQLELRWAAVQPLLKDKPRPIQKGMETVYEDRKKELPF